MADENRMMGGDVDGGAGSVAYEAPRLRAVGNLRDILAGPGSFPCDSGNVTAGPDGASGPIGTPGECAG
jgi:hypothetical protein